MGINPDFCNMKLHVQGVFHSILHGMPKSATELTLDPGLHFARFYP